MAIIDVSGVRKFIGPAASAVTALTAVTTTLNVAAEKFSPGAPLWPDKAMILVSRVIGIDATRSIQKQLGLPTTNIAPQGINALGPLNMTTIGGAIILGVDKAIHSFIGAKYGYQYASPFVKAIGAGLLTGGIIGGIFDPEPNPSAQYINNLPSVNSGQTPGVNTAIRRTM